MSEPIPSAAGPLQRAASLGIREVPTLHGPWTTERHPPPSDEAQAFRARRRALGLYLGAAARRLGICVATCSGLESGRVVPAAPTTWADLERVMVGGGE